MDINEQVTSILAYGECCDHCLGRFFGKRSHGLTNDERGRSLVIARAIAENKPYTKFTGTCWVCGNFFDTVPAWADRVAAAVQGIEHAPSLIGCRVPPLIAENEEMVWSDLSLSEPEPFKSEVNREVGKAVAVRTGKTVDFKRPDIVILLDPLSGTTEVQKCRSTRSFSTGDTRSLSVASRRHTGTAAHARAPAAKNAILPVRSTWILSRN